MSKYSDKLQEWIDEAKKDGLDPTLAKWTFKLSRASGILEATTRELKANEDSYSSLVYRIRAAVGTDTETAKELDLLAAFIANGRKELAQAQELVTAAETVLELLQRRPAVALTSVPAEKKGFTK